MRRPGTLKEHTCDAMLSQFRCQDHRKKWLLGTSFFEPDRFTEDSIPEGFLVGS